ncbi:MAG: hypothetical protein ACN4GM_04285, partial [Gammaproteobacteria bacterium]
AFAHALGQALEYEHLLYYEFGCDSPQPEVIRIHDGKELAKEPPTSAFDRVMTEACALSEGASTILILDQFQLAEFQQHIRLYEFIRSKQWSYSDVQFVANAQHLLIFVVSAEPLYHSLQQVSFRIWIGSLDTSLAQIQPEELGLDEASIEWLVPLNDLLEALGVSPALSEYRKLAYDIEQSVRNQDQLKASIFGWVEGVDRKRLMGGSLNLHLERVMRGIESNMGIQEEIELSSETGE